MSMILLGMFFFFSFFNTKFVFFCLFLDSWFFVLLCHCLHVHVLYFLKTDLGLHFNFPCCMDV